MCFPDLPKFNLIQRWNGSYGKEYEFLISQANRLKERNEKKQNWIDIDSCDFTGKSLSEALIFASTTETPHRPKRWGGGAVVIWRA